MIVSKVWLVAAVALAGIASSAATAQTTLKIGVISVARLIEQSPQYASVTKKLEDEFGPRQREHHGGANEAAHSDRAVPERFPGDGRSGAAQSRAADPRRAARAWSAPRTCTSRI